MPSRRAPRGCTNFKLRQLTRRVSQHYDRVVGAVRPEDDPVLAALADRAPRPGAAERSRRGDGDGRVDAHAQPAAAGRQRLGRDRPRRRRPIAPRRHHAARPRQARSRRSASGSARSSPSTSGSAPPASPSCMRCSTTASPPCRHRSWRTAMPESIRRRARARVHRSPSARPARRRRHLRGDDGRAPVDGAVPRASSTPTTGLGLASISLAFGVGQLWWGLTQPVAGIVADRYGAGRVVLFGLLLVALGTALVPLMTTTFGLIVAIGVLAAGGAGIAGPSVLLAATARLTPPATARHRHRHRQRRRLVRPVRRSCRSRKASPRLAGWAIAIQSMAADRRCSPAARPGCCAASSAARAPPARRAAPARAETTREAIRRALRDPSYLLLARRLLRLRLPRRLHRHAPAGRRRRVPAAAGGRRLVARDHRPLQHRRQLRDRAGRSAAGA